VLRPVNGYGAKLTKDRTYHPQKSTGTNGGFVHFKNQQSSLDNHQSIPRKTAGTVPHLAIHTQKGFSPAVALAAEDHLTTAHTEYTEA
jgi:hypothetical protein